MAFYGALAMLTLVLGVAIKPSASDQRKKAYVVTVFALLICLAALRSQTVGIDTKQFASAYARIGTEGWAAFGLERYEPGFTAMCLFLNLFSDNYQLLLVVTAVLIYAPIGAMVRRYSVNAVLSCFLFITLNLFTGYMNVMRQGLSVAFILLAGFALMKGKKGTFVLLILVASLFHVYALAAMVLWPLSRVGFGKRCLLGYALAFLVGVFGINLVIEFSQLLLRRQEIYDAAFMGSNYFGAVIQFAFAGVISLITINYLHVLNKGAPVGGREGLAFYQHSLMLWTFFMLLGIQIEVFSRLAYYFQIFAIFAIPLALTAPSAKERDIVQLVLCTVCFAYFVIIGVYRPEWQGVIPYVIDICNFISMI